MGLADLTKNSITVIGCVGESQHMEKKKTDTRSMISRKLRRGMLLTDLVGSHLVRVVRNTLGGSRETEVCVKTCG